MSYAQQFYVMLNQVPWLAPYWDQNTDSMKVEKFENMLGVWSSSEVALAQFFAAVWNHNSQKYGFDVVDIASKLDPVHRQLIAEWIANPFYP